MNLFLVFCMGNSGGSWIEAACNLHPLVACWEEQHKRLNLPNLQDWKKRDRAMLKFLHRQIRLSEAGKTLKTFERVNQQTVVTKKRGVQSIGFIKSFGTDVVDFVLGQGGHVVQLYRHPIKVVDWKMGKKKPEAQHVLGRLLKTQRDVFEGHVKFYAQRYRFYLDRADEYRLIRIEDIGASLVSSDARYFIDTFEYMTGVEWTAEHIQRVRRKAKPRHRKDWKYPRRFQEDYQHRKIWKHKWKDWQREMFLKYFEQIMREADYDWPGG